MRKSRILISASAVFFFSLATLKPGLAQTESDQQNLTPTVDPEIKQKVEQRIQDVLTAKDDQKRAFVGEITGINSVVEIETNQGTKQVKIDEKETAIIGLKRENLKAADLEINQYVIAMGYLDNNEVLEAKRVVITTKPETNSQSVVFGQVADKSSDGENILTLKHLKENKTYDVEVTKKTILAKKVDGKIEEIEFDEVETRNLLVVIGEKEDGNGFITAKTIRVVSPQTAPDQKENQSESPSLNPSLETEE